MIKHRRNDAKGILRCMIFTACLVLLPSVYATNNDHTEYLPPLDEPMAFSVHHQIERWVREGNVDDRGQRSLQAADVMGVYVTLRNHGITIGIGESLNSNLHEASANATQQAINAAKQTIADAQLRAATQGFAHENEEESDAEQTDERDWSEIASRWQVDVQIGYGLEQIHLLPHDPAEAVFAAFVPGYHGLSIQRTQEQPASRLWPATTLAANLSAANQITSLLNQQNLARDYMPQLGRPGQAKFERFRVRHVVRPVRQLPPLVLTRGGVDIPLSIIDRQRLANMSEAVADTLAQRVTSEGITRGNYMPSADRYVPDTASDVQAMLGAWVLIHHHRLSNAPLEASGYRAANRVVNHLGLRDPDPTKALRLEAVGLMLLAELDRPESEQRTAIIQNLVDAIVQRIDDEGILRESKEKEAAALPTTSQAVLAYSLARAYDTLSAKDTEVWSETLGMLLDALWLRVMERPSLSTLAWLIPAQYEAGMHLVQREIADPAWWEERKDMMRNTLDQIVDSQITRSPMFGPNDVLGGYQLVDLPHGAAPAPNWHSAQVLIMIAVALRKDETLPSETLDRWLISAQLAARFLDQLRFKPANAYYARNVEDTVGGIRHALYDNEMSSSSCAMGLLAIDQFRITVDALTQVQIDEDAAE